MVRMGTTRNAKTNAAAKIDTSSIVEGNVVVGENTRIGAFVSIKSGAIIGSNVRIEDGARIYEDCVIGDGCIVGANAVLRPRTKIGHNSTFGTLSCSEGDNSIGNYTTVHAQCHLMKGLIIGDNCFIAPMFIATNTPDITQGPHGPKQKVNDYQATTIKDHVRIGVCVRVVPGVTIGDHARIDMDTLVTKDVPAYAHVRGGKDKVGRVIGKAAK